MIGREDLSAFDFKSLKLRFTNTHIKLLICMFFKGEVTTNYIVKEKGIYRTREAFYQAINYLKRNHLVKEERPKHSQYKVYSLTRNGEIMARMFLGFETDIPKPLNDYGIRFV